MHTIRAWEARYEAVVPVRTSQGQRRFTDADIERLQLLRRATEGGRPISEVAGQDTAELRRIVRRDEATVLEGAMGPGSIPRSQQATTHLEDCLRATANLDARTLKTALTRAIAALDAITFCDHLAAPLLQRIGDWWEQGRIKPRHEHLASTVIGGRLVWLLHSFSAAPGAPVLLSATPVGERHEFGALLAAISAGAMGWESHYLGPSLPAAEIVAGARDLGARAVALSIVYPQAAIPERELRTLTEDLHMDCVLLIGGRGAGEYTAVTRAAGAAGPGDLAGLRSTLAMLEERRL